MEKNKIVFKLFLFIFLLLCFNVDLVLASSNLSTGVCEFSDEYKEWLKLPEEKRKLQSMPLMCKVSSSESIINNITSYSLQRSTVLPSSYDSRNVTLSDGTKTSYVTSVKNQGDTGTCWAFAANAVIESYLLKSNLGTYDLSERHMEYTLANNSYTDNTTYEKIFNRELDVGGNAFMSSTYLMSNLGSVSESAVPFINSSNPTTYSSINNSNVKQVVDVNSISFITSTYNNGTYSCSENSNTIKQMIMNYGAVSSNVYMSNSYFNTSTSALYYNGTNSTDHAITIVGWDDNYSKSNFISGTQPTSDGAWIIKNSWGEDAEYMDEGYFYVSYEDTQICGIVTAITDVDTDMVDNTYQNEKQGINTGAGYSYASNIYTREDTTKKEVLTEVTVGAFQSTDVTLYLVDNVTSTSDLRTANATKLGTVSIPYEGYETLKLDESIEITGEKFAIISYYSNYTGSYPIGISVLYPSGIYSTVPETTGVSYVSSNGKTWADTGTNEDPYVVVLKAGTNIIDYSIEIEEDSNNVKVNNVDGGSYKYNLNTTNIEVGEEISIKIYNSSDEDVTDDFTINGSNNSNISVTSENGTTLEIGVSSETELDTYTLELIYGEVSETIEFKVYEKKSITIDKVEKSLETIYDVNQNETIKYYLTFENIDDNTEITASIEAENLNYDIEASITNIQNEESTIALTIKQADAGDYKLIINVNDSENGIISLEEIFTIEKYNSINNLSFSKSSLYLEIGDSINLKELLTTDIKDELVNWSITSGSEYISLEDGVITSNERGISTINVVPKYETTNENNTATITINSILSEVIATESTSNSDIFDILGGNLSYVVEIKDVTDLYVKIHDINGNLIYTSETSSELISSSITKESDDKYNIDITFNPNNTSGTYKLEMGGIYVSNDEILSSDIAYLNIEILDEIKVEGVTITNTENYLYVGERLDITTIVSPNNATINNLSYTSSNAMVANFENNTLIANSSGNVTITVTANSGVIDTKKFTILDPSISLGQISYEINENVYNTDILYDKIGGIIKIPYEIKDVNTSEKVYKVEDTLIETSLNISKNENDKCYEIEIPKNTVAGNYRFTVTSFYTDNSGEVILEPINVNFEVMELIEVTSITFSDSSYTVDIDDGSFEVNPIINENKNVPTYLNLNIISSDENVAKVENNTLKILNVGETTITVSSINGVSGSFILKVEEETVEEQSINIFENSSYINNVNKYITNVSPKTKKNTFISNLNLDNVSYTINGVASQTNYITTGTTLVVTQNNQTTTYTIIIFGDVNGDGQIMANDYMMIKNSVLSKFYSNITDPITTTNRKLAADVNGDNKIMANDYMMIKNSVLSRFNDNITDPIKQNKTINGGN